MPPKHLCRVVTSHSFRVNTEHTFIYDKNNDIKLLLQRSEEPVITDFYL